MDDDIVSVVSNVMTTWSVAVAVAVVMATNTRAAATTATTDLNKWNNGPV